MISCAGIRLRIVLYVDQEMTGAETWDLRRVSPAAFAQEPLGLVGE
jgi:hypothetical protein